MKYVFIIENQLLGATIMFYAQKYMFQQFVGKIVERGQFLYKVVVQNFDNMCLWQSCVAMYKFGRGQYCPKFDFLQLIKLVYLV